MANDTVTIKLKQANLFWLRVLYLGLPVIHVTWRMFPSLIKSKINNALKKTDGYFMHLETVHPSAESGSYSIKGFVLEVDNEQGTERALFISADNVLVKLDRKALWNGVIAGEIIVDKPSIRFMMEHKPGYNGIAFQDKFEITIKSFELRNGRLELIDERTDPKVGIEMQNIHITASDITNIPASHHLPTQVTLRGNAYGGTIKGTAKANFLKEHPAFDLDVEVKNINMRDLNSIFLAYGDFDVNRGTMDVYTEITSANGSFNGFVEPVIKDLEIAGPQDKGMGILHAIKENTLSLMKEIFENHHNGQLATKIRFEDKHQQAKVHTWYAIYEVLVNAFVHALKPSFHLREEIKAVKNEK